MDEPSTGLDPASRYNLWSVIRESKQDRAIILTSMLSDATICYKTDRDKLQVFNGLALIREAIQEVINSMLTDRKSVV